MAHWEERDPRWVVNDRGSEGTNVDGWHWEERSLKKEARSKLDSLFTELNAEMNPSIGTAKITAITEVTGEVSCLCVEFPSPSLTILTGTSLDVNVTRIWKALAWLYKTPALASPSLTVAVALASCPSSRTV